MLKKTGDTHVVLYDTELLRRQTENREYLLELNAKKLLLPYLCEAGVFKAQETPEGIHGGWESPLCELRGHFLGHWLSAAAMNYAATKDGVLKARTEEVIDLLELCQRENGDGWCAGIPEKYLDRLSRGLEVWAPQYTIHKIFMGLLDAYELCGIDKALEIADRFGGWFENWCTGFSEEEFQRMLSVETGGMLEIWAILLRLTGKERYQILCEKYYRKELFDALLENRDVLTNMHANTTIPEILGAAACYEVTGKKKYFDIVRAYWKQAVTDRGTYATGGQTCGEIWTPKKYLAHRLGDKNQEHCTVYNMMRLAEFLYRYTEDMKYMDYWELNLYNGIMAQGYWRGSFTHGYRSMYPTEGLISYFLPLRGGSQKGWGSKTNDFFCCHGSLVQANAAHNKCIYYTGETHVAVCQYISSEFTGQVNGNKVRIRQIVDPMNGSSIDVLDSLGTQKINGKNDQELSCPERFTVHFIVESEEICAIRFRVPKWADGVRIKVDGKETSTDEVTDGSQICLKDKWNQARIELSFGRKISVVPLPGQEEMVAFLDGPVLLAGLCDEERRLYVRRGEKPEQLLIPDNEREWGSWMRTFKTVGQDRGIRFVPLNRIGYERYSVYFPLSEKTE